MKKVTLCILFFFLLVSFQGEATERLYVIPPKEGIYHSAHPDFGLRDDDVTEQRVDSFLQLAEKAVVWSYISDHWYKGISFPKEACLVLHRKGIIPLIGMMPWSTLQQNKKETKYTLDRIIKGDFDKELQLYAHEVAALGFPVMIEFGPEANGAWFPWSAVWNGGAEKRQYGDSDIPDGPERFRDAYRHIVSLFRAEGVSNVTWVFHLASAPWPDKEWNAPRYYYPGDEWVDWIGVSVYGRLRSGEAKPFHVILKKIYPQLTALSPKKPLAILEMGVSEERGKRDKAEWIALAFSHLKAGAYPRIKAVSWWNKIYRPDRSRSYLEVDSSPSSLSAYREAVADLVDRVEWQKIN